MTVEQLILKLQQIKNQKKEVWLHIGRYWEVRAVTASEDSACFVLSD